MNINGQNIFLRAIRNEHKPSVDDSYPFNLPIVRNPKTIEFTKSVTYIVGENGSGKSTLLDAIANLLATKRRRWKQELQFQDTRHTLFSL